MQLETEAQQLDAILDQYDCHPAVQQMRAVYPAWLCHHLRTLPQRRNWSVTG